MNDQTDTLKKLNESFGSYRAEWLKEKVFDMFAEPFYFAALQDNRPFVLEGGRGTGKTTVLKGLSYEGQFVLRGSDIAEFNKNSFIGIYHRVNTNHVRSFLSGGVSLDDWKKIFGHYFNLVITREFLLFLKWYQVIVPNAEALSNRACDLIAKSLHVVKPCKDLNILLESVELEMYEFQAKVNNISEDELPPLSMFGDPIKIASNEIVQLRDFKEKIFFILLDEYENFEDYQQQIINTLIKHSSEDFCFKIGVRELGWRIKHTLNPNELLHDPADYVLINIERKFADETHFPSFAKLVCKQRITQLFDDSGAEFQMDQALASLSPEEEAILLGVESTQYYKEFEDLPTPYKRKLNDEPDLFKFFIAYWSSLHNTSLKKSVDDYQSNSTAWMTRYENYKYEMLFKIRKGRGKRGIQKYYCGWNTLIKLSNGNIRYLMELVYRSYEKHLEDGNKLRHVVNPKNQTLAAQEVGLKNLMELEGLWKNGAQLTKLLLGFGRIFQILASAERKTAPEQNQFALENSESISDECQELLNAAVMNLALVRTPGNKLASDTPDTRAFDYMIHPIYAAFFMFSYRRKRKIIIRQEDIFGIIKSPKETIKNILLKSNISKIDESLPTQMNLFQDFYEDKQ